MVLLNTWAVELDLGTGGADFVIASEDQTTVDAAPVGHVMKLRYTPLQQPVLAAEAPESTWHSEVAGFQSLEMTPVVCAELHSQLPAIAAAAKWETHGAARVAYVMTDEAALPLAYSHLVRDLREKGLIDVTITSGQAFGGDYEAVNLYSALAVAKVAGKADIIIVGQGPGNTGTETPLGFSGIAQGIALNAVAALDDYCREAQLRGPKTSAFRVESPYAHGVGARSARADTGADPSIAGRRALLPGAGDRVR
jgi:hypothetical protein